jgi:hypothetical protein
MSNSAFSVHPLPLILPSFQPIFGFLGISGISQRTVPQALCKAAARVFVFMYMFFRENGWGGNKSICLPRKDLSAGVFGKKTRKRSETPGKTPISPSLVAQEMEVVAAIPLDIAHTRNVTVHRRPGQHRHSKRSEESRRNRDFMLDLSLRTEDVNLSKRGLGKGAVLISASGLGSKRGSFRVPFRRTHVLSVQANDRPMRKCHLLLSGSFSNPLAGIAQRK